MDPQVIADLQSSIQAFNDQVSSFSATMASMVNAINQNASAIKDGTSADKKNTDSTSKGAGSVDPLARANADAAGIVKEANANFAAAAAATHGALRDFTGAVLSAESGMAKYGKAAEGMGTASLLVGKNFGLLGTALGLGLGAFGALTASVFKLDDNIVNFRDSFTTTAGVLPATTTEIGNLAKQARFSLDDMQKLSKATNSLGQNLLGMGGYAGEGAVKFMKMAAVGDETRRRFGRMGISQDQLLDAQTKYVEMQGVSGQALNNQSKSTKQMQQESLDYAENLTRMSSLTGKKADQLQADRDATMAEYEEQAQVAKENKQIADLRAKTGDASAQAEANRIAAEQKKRQEFLQTISDTEGKERAAMVGKIYRQGGYDKSTGALANQGVLEDINRYKASNGSKEAQIAAADRMKKSGVEAASKYNTALQAGGENLGKALAIGQEFLVNVNKQDPESLSKTYSKITEDMNAKGKEGADSLADSIEVVRSIERESKAKFQTFLESNDPLRGSMQALRFAAIAATAMLGSLALGKLASKIPGIGGLFGGGGKAAGGAAKVAGSAAKVAGSAESAAMQNLNKVAASGGGATGGFLKGLVEGLASAGKPPIPMYLTLGAGAIGAAITLIGAGLAGATWIMGKAMPSLANGLKAFDKLNGPNLKQVGMGMAGLGAGILAMGAGKVVGAIGNIVNLLVGGEDPITKVASQVIELQSFNFDKTKVKNNSEAMFSFSKAMAEASAIGAAGSVAAAGGAIAGGIASFFGGKPPLEQFVAFSRLKIDEKQTRTNAQAFVEFSTAMSSYKGMDSGIGALTATLGDATAKFFGVKPPVDQFAYFARLPIDAKKAESNSKSFVAFANAMAEYKGGPGLADTISSLAGAGLNKIFGGDGPIEAFAKFAKMDFGPKAKDNSEAFFKYAQSANMISSGGGGGVSGGGGGIPSSGVRGGIAESFTSGMNAGSRGAGAVAGFIGGGAPAIGSAASDAFSGAINFGKSIYNKFMGKTDGVDSNTLQKFGKVQGALGNKSIYVTSGARPAGWVTPRGVVSSKSNPHVVKRALDLGITGDQTAVVQAAIKAGFTGIGGEGNHIHIDDSHPQLTLWGEDYTSKSTPAWLKKAASMRAKDGGIFGSAVDDPGLPSMPNGKKLAPLQLDSLLMQLAKTNVETINQVKNTVPAANHSHEDQGAMNLELYNMIQHKLDYVLTALDNSHSTQSKILKHTMV